MTTLTDAEKEEFTRHFMAAVKSEFGHLFPQHAKQIDAYAHPWDHEGEFKQSFAKWYEDRKEFYNIPTAAMFWKDECDLMYLYDWDHDEWKAIFEDAFYQIFHERFGLNAVDDREMPKAVGKPWTWIETDKSPLHELWNMITYEPDPERCARNWFYAVKAQSSQT